MKPGGGKLVLLIRDHDLVDPEVGLANGSSHSSLSLWLDKN